MSEEKKGSIWICQKCGVETPQPGGNEPIVACCPGCGEIHTHLKEPDGNITEFVDAPEWFIKEFNERMDKIQQKEQQLAQACQQEMQLRYDTIPELRDKCKNAAKQQSVGLEQALRRTHDNKGVKLSKRQEFGWMYHPMIKKFSGREKVKPNVNFVEESK